MAAHKWANEIKAWADGATIQAYSGGYWTDVTPTWNEDDQYRIKPAEPERPLSQMTEEELRKLLVQNRGLCESTTMARIVANAALRHACDAGQIVTREEFDRAVGDRRARDVKVAQAALDKAYVAAMNCVGGLEGTAVRQINISEVIDSLK